MSTHTHIHHRTGEFYTYLIGGLFAFGILIAASWYSVESSAVYFESVRNEPTLKALIFALMLSGTVTVSTMLAPVLGNWRIAAYAFAVFTVAVSGYTIFIGKAADSNNQVTQERISSIDYQNLLDDQQQARAREASLQQQIEQQQATITEATQTLTAIAAAGTSGKYAKRRHNEKMERTRSLKNTKRDAETSLKNLKTEQQITAKNTRKATQAISDYNSTTQQLQASALKRQQLEHIGWSLFPDLLALLMAVILEKTIIAMWLIKREKQQLQRHVTVLQNPVTADTDTVIGTVTTDNAPETTPVITDKMLLASSAKQSKPGISIRAAKMELIEAIELRTAPLSYAGIKKNFPAFKSNPTIKKVLEHCFAQGFLDRRADKADRIHYAYPLAGEEGGKHHEYQFPLLDNNGKATSETAKPDQPLPDNVRSLFGNTEHAA